MIDEVLIDQLVLSTSIREDSELYEITNELKSSNFKGTPHESIELIEKLKKSHKLTKKDKIVCDLLFSLYLDDTNQPMDGLKKILALKEKFSKLEESNSKGKFLKYLILVVQSRLLISLGEFDEGLEILNKAIDLFSSSETPIDLKHRIALKIIESSLQYRKGNLDTTLEILQGEFKLINELGTLKDKVFLLNTLGVIFYQKGNLEKSLNYHYQSLEIRKNLGNKRLVAVSLSNIGLVFYDKGQFAKAFDYYQQSLTIFQEVNDKSSITWTLNNIAIIYGHQGQLDMALEGYFQCLSLSKDIGNKDLIALSLNNIGGIYLEKTDYNEAKNYLQKSLTIFKEIGNKMRISSTLSTLAYVYFMQHKLELIEELLLDFPLPPYESVQIEGFRNMVLAYSEQLKGNAGNAIKLWSTVIENKAIEFSDQIRSLETLLSLYFKSWINSESDSDLEQINKILDKLSEIAKTNNLVPSICKVFLIRAKLAMAQFDFKIAEGFLIEGLSKAQESGLPIFKQLFNKELTFYKKKIDQIRMFSSSDEERYKQHQFQDIDYSLQGIEKIYREKEKSDRLLSNILPKEVIPHLKEQQSPYSEEFQNVSILFADMVDFSKLSVTLGSKKMVYLLNEIFSHFDSLLDKYSAEKIRTIGDNYMVSVGVPKRNFDHAELIANLALDMQNYLNTPKSNGSLPKFRIGINSGSVVASVIGQRKFQFDLLSETVNIASRMESHGVPGKIQVTQDTYDLIKNKFIFEKREKINVKGMGEMATWFLLKKK